MDTTANQTLAAYDRIIFYGEQLIGSVVEDSAKAFRYDDHPDFGDIDQGKQKLSQIMLSNGYCDQLVFRMFYLCDNNLLLLSFVVFCFMLLKRSHLTASNVYLFK